LEVQAAKVLRLSENNDFMSVSRAALSRSSLPTKVGADEVLIPRATSDGTAFAQYAADPLRKIPWSCLQAAAPQRQPASVRSAHTSLPTSVPARRVEMSRRPTGRG
jgi:hypothetical protein